MMLMITLALFVAAAVELQAVEINCETVDRLIRFKKCCFLNETTSIEAYNVKFVGNEMFDFDAIYFGGNKKVQLLPVNVYKKFPNLEIYLAGLAAVKEISAPSFERLLNLKMLDLSSNKIKFIPDDCFQGLIRLQKIYLSMEITILAETLKIINFCSQVITKS